MDAATDTDKTGDIYLEDGIIAEMGQKLKKKDGRPCDRCERKAGSCRESSTFMSIFVIRARHIRRYPEWCGGGSTWWCDNCSCYAKHNSHYR